MNAPRTGPWMLTASGRQFFPLDPRPDDVCIADVARALSRICRFGGHSREFYSVAQHSELVACLSPARLGLHALLHDAAEAYVGDMIDPIKRALRTTTPAFDLIEGKVEFAIARHFKLGPLSPYDRELIKKADILALATELRDVMPPNHHGAWPQLAGVEPDEEVVVPMSADAAETVFLDYFQRLMR